MTVASEPPGPPFDPDEAVRLFEEARDLPTAERTALLGERCAGRDRLREEIESLLEATDHGPDFLLPAPAEDSAESPIAGLGPGTRIGPYRLLEVLGTGGMGTVYRASRESGGFDQEVALKLTHARPRLVPGDGGRLEERFSDERFLRERQILARLEHPNIARLLDGGVSGEGLPWFAMELVRGAPLTEACDDARLGVRERVGILRDACRAVQFAHAQLVVHRDLKPSNMMVDENGRLQLLDFGIAKLLDDPSGPGGTLTRTGLAPHTPGYAAPEQTRGDAATVATDVYSLGVILYELLTGRRPERDPTSGELTRGARPSTAVLRSSESAAPGRDGTASPDEIAAARSTTPGELSRSLSGDLEAIVRQALEAEPSRRYATADAMAEDLDRYLEGLPVAARAATFRYRAGKLLRRHWAVALASAVALLALVGGLAASLWQARVASAERDRARLEAEKAREVQDLLVEVFSSADPNRAAGEELTATELLQSGLEKVRSDEGTDPDVRATLFEAMARVFKTQSDLEKMEEAATEAVELRRELTPEGSRELAGALRLLASARYRLGRMQEGEEIHREALAMLRENPDVPPLELASALNSLAVTLHDQYELAEAEPFYREALEIRRAELGEDDPSVGISLGNFGLLLMDLGRYEEADRLLMQGQETLIAAHGPDHTTVATNWTFVAKNRRKMGDLDGAEEALRKALGTYERLLGEDHVMVARTLEVLALVASDRGDLTEAERLVRRSIELQTAYYGGDHINVGAAFYNLAAFLFEAGEQDRETLEAAEEAVRIRAPLGSGDPVWSTAMGLRGRLLARLGRPDEAREVFDEVIGALADRFGPEDSRVEGARESKEKALGEGAARAAVP